MTQPSVHLDAFFQFEADFVESLRCIPMQVRMKLDTCGIKLKLHQWHQFTYDERQYLVDAPCDAPDQVKAYRDTLQHLVFNHTGESAKELTIDANPPWHSAEAIPESVLTQAADLEISLTLDHWARLSPLQRFALIKLSRSNHENSNFVPALREFGVVTSDATS
jgi:hypothetical protein